MKKTAKQVLQRFFRKGWGDLAPPKYNKMLLDDYPIVIWTIVKKNNNYILLDSCGIEVFRRKENRKKEIYQYCEDNGIDVQEEF